MLPDRKPAEEDGVVRGPHQRPASCPGATNTDHERVLYSLRREVLRLHFVFTTNQNTKVDTNSPEGIGPSQ